MTPTIGHSLTGMLRLPTLPGGRSTPADGSVSAAGSNSFAAQLDAGFRARAERLGLELPAASTAPTGASGSVSETVDSIWIRAQLVANANGGGIADSIMEGLDAASQRRAEQRHGRASEFDMFS